MISRVAIPNGDDPGELDLGDVFASVTIRHGRGSVDDGPLASSATLSLVNVTREQALAFRLGRELLIDALDAPRFRGRITDAELDPAEGTLSLVAVSRLSSIASRPVGAAAWPAEPWSSRVERAFAEAGAHPGLPAEDDFVSGVSAWSSYNGTLAHDPVAEAASFTYSAAAGAFGETVDLPTSTGYAANEARVFRYTAPAAGSITKLVMMVGRPVSGVQKLRAVVYADNGVGAGSPGALLAVGPEVTIPTPAAWAWTDLPLSAPLIIAAGQKVHIGYMSLAALGFFKYAAGAGYWQSVKADTFADGPNDPFGTPTAANAFRLSVYASYVPAGGGGIYQTFAPAAAGETRSVRAVVRGQAGRTLKLTARETGGAAAAEETSTVIALTGAPQTVTAERVFARADRTGFQVVIELSGYYGEALHVDNVRVWPGSIAGSLLELTVGDDDPLLAARAADPTTLGGALEELTETVPAAVATTPAGLVLVQAVSSRKGAALVELDPNLVELDLPFVMASEVTNAIEVEWAGGTVSVEDTASIAELDRRSDKIETTLAVRGAAEDRARLELRRRAWPAWTLGALGYLGLDPALSIGDRLLVTELPASAPKAEHVGILEGWEDRVVASESGELEWTMRLGLSAAIVSGAGVSWAEVDPAISWAEADTDWIETEELLYA